MKITWNVSPSKQPIVGTIATPIHSFIYVVCEGCFCATVAECKCYRQRPYGWQSLKDLLSGSSQTVIANLQPRALYTKHVKTWLLSLSYFLLVSSALKSSSGTSQSQVVSLHAGFLLSEMVLLPCRLYRQTHLGGSPTAHSCSFPRVCLCLP